MLWKILFILILALIIHADKKQNYAVKVAGVDIVPDPVVRGKPATFKISASSGDISLCCPLFLFLFSFISYWCLYEKKMYG